MEERIQWTHTTFISMLSTSCTFGSTSEGAEKAPPETYLKGEAYTGGWTVNRVLIERSGKPTFLRISLSKRTFWLKKAIPLRLNLRGQWLRLPLTNSPWTRFQGCPQRFLFLRSPRMVGVRSAILMLTRPSNCGVLIPNLVITFIKMNELDTPL